MRRPIRLAAAVLAMFALLFAQLAVSAFACPVHVPAQVAPTPMPGGHCGEPVNRNLCDSHCGYGSAHVGQGMLDLSFDIQALALPWRAEALVALAPSAPPRALYRTRPAHAPPPLTLFGALRI